METRGRVLQQVAALGFLMVGLFCQACAVAQEAQVSFEQMLPFTELLNEVSKRRRLTVYQPNVQSVYDGVPVAFVNTNRGNVSFFRDDLIELGPIPIVMRRMYDSDLSVGPDFGNAGWRLSITETIAQLSNGKYHYTNASGVRALLERRDQALVAVHPEPGRWGDIEFVSSSALQIRYHDGLLKSFTASGDGTVYRLRTVSNQNGSKVHLIYDSQERLQKVMAGASTVELVRDEGGRIMMISSTSGKQVRYLYTQGRLTTVLDLGGYAWKYAYDSRNRLVSAHSPGEDTDLLIDYLDGGKVAGISHNSSPVGFRYSQGSLERGVIAETIVTRENGGIFRYGHDATGRMIFAANAAGHRFRLRFDKMGLVHRVTVNGSLAYEIMYSAAGLPRQIHEYRDDVMITHRLEYDEKDRLRSVSDDIGGIRVRVVPLPDGQIVEHHDLGLQLLVDNNGNLVRVVAANGTRADIKYDSVGNPHAVAIDGGAPVRLHYTPFHRLRQIDYANGESRQYIYDDIGLRRSISGASANTWFSYSPAGNLIKTRRSRLGGDPGSQTLYELDDAERLVGLEQNGTHYTLTYNELGDLEELAVDNRLLRFDYDVLSRFYQVSTGNDQRWTYSYQSGETDIRQVADLMTSLTLTGSSLMSAGFSRLYAVTRIRMQSTLYGVVHVDTVSGHVDLTPGYGLQIPGVMQLQGLIKARLLRVDGPRLLDGTGENGKKRFDAPSNILFLPPELAAVNCIFCPGLEPHEDPISPSGMVSQQPVRDAGSSAPASLANIAQRLSAACDYGLPGGPNDPPACVLEISGMPAYLCASQSLTLGASGSVDVNLNSVVWSSNSTIDFIPFDFAHVGPSVQIMATAPGHAFVSADYLGQGNVCQDTVDAPILANEVTLYADVVNSAICPERQQDSDLSHDVDGCSIPAITGMLLGMFSPQDPVGGMPPNAALPTTFGQHELPPIFSAADLTYPLPCNRHDVCYQTCGANRLDCDDQMLDNMETVCSAAYPACPFSDSGLCMDWEDDKEHCEDMSELIHRGIRLFGSTAYKNRQVQYCDCCRP